MKIDPFASGVLKPDAHGRLVADLENISRAVNIPQHWIWTPLADICAPAEVAWVKRFRFHTPEGRAGLCHLGREPKMEIETRMAAIAGALTRNFVRARMMTLNDVLAGLEDGEVPDMTCLLIPNFFVEKKQGGNQPAWRVSQLFDLLVSRHTAGLQTVLYVSDMEMLGSEYGAAIKRHVAGLYELVGA
jgi:hypothetical protein